MVWVRVGYFNDTKKQMDIWIIVCLKIKSLSITKNIFYYFRRYYNIYLITLVSKKLK